MRIFFPALMALTIAAPATAATRNFGVSGFQTVRVDGPFHVSLATGVAPFARASGTPAALDRIAIEVRGDTLVVHNNLSNWGGYPGKDSGPVEISIGTHDLSAAWINGSGALSIDGVKGLSFDLSVQGSGVADIGEVNVDRLNVSVLGTASATLRGRAARMTSVVRGISSLDALSLATKDATIGVEGAATVKANVGNSVTVDGSGPATVEFDGGPACTLRVSGSVTIRGCRSSQ